MTRLRFLLCPLSALLLWVVCLCSAGLSSCASSRPPAGRIMNADLTLVSFGSIDGELTDCGCHSHPRGGLPWRAGLIDSLTNLEKPLLQLDLGNFAPLVGDAAEFKMRFLWEKMAELGVHATTPGAAELHHLDAYRELISGGELAVVSSNLKLVQDGAEKPLGEPFLVVPVNGVRVGLIGLMGKDEFANAEGPAGVELHFVDPIEVATALVPTVRAQADLVVLMSEMSTQETDQLLRAVPGIDVALYGNRPAFNEDATMVGQTIAQQTGIRGQYVGLLTLIVGPDGGIVEHDARNIAVDKLLGEDAEMKAEVEDAEAKIKLIEAEARASRPAAQQSDDQQLGVEPDEVDDSSHP